MVKSSVVSRGHHFVVLFPASSLLFLNLCGERVDLGIPPMAELYSTDSRALFRRHILSTVSSKASLDQPLPAAVKSSLVKVGSGINL